jgi:hypothetical protein
MLNTWAGSDGLRPARGRRVDDSWQQPDVQSVHLVDEVTGEVACGWVDPSSLAPLERPWTGWGEWYRCRRCHRLRPMG